MLNVYIPEAYHTDQRALRAIMSFGIDAKGEIPADAKKVVWAVADRTADTLQPIDYREYDYSDVDTLCFGGDDEILIDMGVIKPNHDVITIPGLAWSLYMDQAIAVILAHYVKRYPSEDRNLRVAELVKNKRAEQARRKAMQSTAT